MSKTIINSNNLNKAINELKYKSVYIDKLMSEMDNLSDEVAKINMDHNCFPITTRWIEAVQSKLNHYGAKIDELKYLCQSVVDIFSSTSEKAKASTNLIKEFNESPYYLTARQDLYRLLTGKEGELKLTYNNNELGSNVTGAYKTSFSNWNNTILNELKGRDWLTKEKIEEVTKALTTGKAASIINSNLTPNNTTEITGGESASSSSSTKTSSEKQLNTLNKSPLRDYSDSNKSTMSELTTPKTGENTSSTITTDDTKQKAALDTMLSNTNNAESSASVQNNSQSSQSTQSTEKAVNPDRMKQAQKSVEVKSQPSSPTTSGEKTVTNQPSTSTDVPKEKIEKPSSGSSPIEPDISTPEPKHKTIPKDGSTTVTKVPKTETAKQTSTSSGNASKVIPVIAGVAAAGAAGIGTKIYLDNKSKEDTGYTNEEFVIDDSDYKATNYESAEINTNDTDLLKEESYTTRSNSESSTSSEEVYEEGISDDMTYGMNFQDNDITFDETTPYEAIDNKEIGETH